MFKGLISL